MERPEPPAEAVLIRRARKAAGMQVAQAAGRARSHAPGLRLSTAWWSTIENGYETKPDGPRAVAGSDDIVAHMAWAVDLAADRLEHEGKRPDAADVLREILRRDEDAARARQRRSRSALQRIAEDPDLTPAEKKAHIDLARRMAQHGTAEDGEEKANGY